MFMTGCSRPTESLDPESSRLAVATGVDPAHRDDAWRSSGLSPCRLHCCGERGNQVRLLIGDWHEYGTYRSIEVVPCHAHHTPSTPVTRQE